MILQKIEECLHLDDLIYLIKYDTGIDSEPYSIFRICERCSHFPCFSKYIISKKKIDQMNCLENGSSDRTNPTCKTRITH
jgi:hypothetical protein